MRVFESLACGSMLITNDLTDNARPSCSLMGSPCYIPLRQDVLEKLAYFMGHPEERERIAGAGP